MMSSNCCHATPEAFCMCACAQDRIDAQAAAERHANQLMLAQTVAGNNAGPTIVNNNNNVAAGGAPIAMIMQAPQSTVSHSRTVKYVGWKTCCCFAFTGCICIFCCPIDEKTVTATTRTR